MKFDARANNSPEMKSAFIAWLVDQTISAFARAGGDHEGLKSSVFLTTNRAREAGLNSEGTAKIVGVSIAGANLSSEQEAIVLRWLETFDPIATAIHEPAKPWWKFWA